MRAATATIADPPTAAPMDSPHDAPTPPQEPVADAQFQRLYEELRGMARALLAAERPGHTLQATALVNEAYLRLLKGSQTSLADAGSFHKLAAVAMRRILVEHARARARDRRGGQAERISLDALELACQGHDSDLLAVEEALTRLEQQDPDLAKLVQLRFYAGLGMEEIAQATGRSVRSVHREWAYAKALLLRELETPGT